MRLLLVWACAALPALAQGERRAQLLAFDAAGKSLDAAGLRAYISRADKRGAAALWGWSPDGLASARPALYQRGGKTELAWKGLPAMALSLPWPVVEDGFSTVLVDRGGRGIEDRDLILLNEEIALTQYRLFKEAWLKHARDLAARYVPSGKATRLASLAREAMAKAAAARNAAARARLFDRALSATSAAWQKLLVEHGQQIAASDKASGALRFGLTLDDSILMRIGDYQWIVEAVRRSGSNWVRLVFRPNPADFAYAAQASFNEYDAIVTELLKRNIRVMGCVLDTAQWPSSLTPALYTERARHLVLHYKDQINSWELGSELNGDWLGGRRSPLSPGEVYRIFSAAAATIKDIESSLEIVATLYWWEGTAPDEEHTLLGWLNKYAPRGFGKNVDVVALSLWPEDSPVGMSLERIFEKTHLALPDKRLMVGSYGYVEGDALKGYWWLDPADVDGSRKDLVTLMAPGACALERSVGGGFWWQTLDQMLPEKHRPTDLYRVYRQSLRQLGR